MSPPRSGTIIEFLIQNCAFYRLFEGQKETGNLFCCLISLEVLQVDQGQSQSQRADNFSPKKFCCKISLMVV